MCVVKSALPSSIPVFNGLRDSLTWIEDQLQSLGHNIERDREVQEFASHSTEIYLRLLALAHIRSEGARSLLNQIGLSAIVEHWLRATAQTMRSEPSKKPIVMTLDARQLHLFDEPEPPRLRTAA